MTGWPENDLYEQVLFLFYQRTFFGRRVPVAKDIKAAKLRPADHILKKRPIAYALNLYVPEKFEDEYEKEGVEKTCGYKLKQNVVGKLLRATMLPKFERFARQSFAEHLIATKALRCTATAWMLIAAQCSAIP